MTNSVITKIVSSFKKGELNEVEFVIEVSKAVGAFGKGIKFKTMHTYAMHLLN